MQINELINILISGDVIKNLIINEEKLFKFIPELKVCKGFNQNNPWHSYDVYEHTLHVVEGVSNNIILRLAALFHDIGKPLTYIEDEAGIGHFYGHWNESKRIFEEFAKRTNLDKNVVIRISNLILHHDHDVEKIDREELLNTFSEEDLINLFELKKSDLLAQSKEYHYLLKDREESKERLLKYYR